MNQRKGDWAEGSLRLISPAELLAALVRKRFTGRLVLASASSPPRVVVLQLADGAPSIVAATGLPARLAGPEESYRARQVALEVLGWATGSFRAEHVQGPARAGGVELGDVSALLRSAQERRQIWPNIHNVLPGRPACLVATPVAAPPSSLAPELALVAAALDGRCSITALGVRTRLDEHLLLQALIALQAAGVVALQVQQEPEHHRDVRSGSLARALLAELEPDAAERRVLKITLVAWDARTSFRTVEALLGRGGRPPENVETHPRFQIIHEAVPLDSDLRLELLAFRADAFEPAFAAPMARNSHLLLVVTDLEANPTVQPSDRPLAERINEIREMFEGASVAGRLSVGAGAVTDPGCDLILPELGRFVDWEDASRPTLLSGLLGEVLRRLGASPENEFAPNEPTAARIG